MYRVALRSTTERLSVQGVGGGSGGVRRGDSHGFGLDQRDVELLVLIGRHELRVRAPHPLIVVKIELRASRDSGGHLFMPHMCRCRRACSKEMSQQR